MKIKTNINNFGGAFLSDDCLINYFIKNKINFATGYSREEGNYIEFETEDLDRVIIKNKRKDKLQKIMNKQ